MRIVLYTGQEFDQEYHLYNYNARLYDPIMARFITADTIVPDWTNPQSLNRYSYVMNNPLKYVDPSGHLVFWAAAMIVGAVIGAVSAGTKTDWDVGEMFKGAAIGAVSGYVGAVAGAAAFAAAGKGVAGLMTGAAVGGAAGGATGGGLSAAVYGGNIGQAMLQGAGYGALAGVITGGLIHLDTPPLIAGMFGAASSGYVEGGGDLALESALYSFGGSLMATTLRMHGIGSDGQIPAEEGNIRALRKEIFDYTYVVTGDRKDEWYWKIISYLNDGFTHTGHTDDIGHYSTPENENYPRYILIVDNNIEWKPQRYNLPQNHPDYAPFGLWNNNCTTRFGHRMPGTYLSHHRYFHRYYWFAR